MAGKSTTFAGEVLGLILNGTPITGIAANAASPLTNLYVSLHTADPGPAGSAQTTNEAAYTGYLREAVARNPASVAWTIAGAVATPNANIVWPTATAGSETETFIGIGTAASGTGFLLYSFALTPAIAVVVGVTPEVLNTSTLTES